MAARIKIECEFELSSIEFEKSPCAKYWQNQYERAHSHKMLRPTSTRAANAVQMQKLQLSLVAVVAPLVAPKIP